MVDTSMLDLFKMEVEQQSRLLSDSLLVLDNQPDSAEHLASAMRAAHSIKGAARLIGIDPAQQIAHLMEDCLVAAQESRLVLTREIMDRLLEGMDMIARIADDEAIESWGDRHSNEYQDMLKQLQRLQSQAQTAPNGTPDPAPAEPASQPTTVIADLSMLELFRMECNQHCATLNDGLLALEDHPSAEGLEALMRAAHSIKGAARLIGLPPIVELTHVMEDLFVAAQQGEWTLSAEDVDQLLKAVDLLAELAGSEEDVNQWLIRQAGRIKQTQQHLSGLRTGTVTATVDAAPRSATGSSSEMSMYELFRVECEQYGEVLNHGLLELEKDPASAERLEPLMRAAHSIKGAARLAGAEPVVKLAHAMEDNFVAAQKGDIRLDADQMDVLLQGLDTIHELAFFNGDLDQWVADHQQRYDILLADLKGILVGRRATSTRSASGEERTSGLAPLKAGKKQVPQKDRVLRISAEQVNRLMGLAGESLVESRWLYPYSESLRRLKRQQTELVCMIDNLREYLERGSINDELRSNLRSLQGQASFCREMMSDRLAELESYDRRSTHLSSRLHREVVESRMRPFGDGVHGFPRMVRDISRSLNKDVQLVIEGESTMVDRDILDKIEAPLNHLIRNAIDHGLEDSVERARTDKPPKGTIRLSAYHHAGMLSIVVEDDGRGVDLERLRRKVVEKRLVDSAMADTLSEAELMEFLFLPSFSTKDEVSEISGRGVGLDVVHDVVQEMRGSVRAVSELGKGTKFQLQLPLTLSVVPALLVEIDSEPYAFPLARIDRIARIPADKVQEAEGNQFVTLDGNHVGLVSAGQILEKSSGLNNTDQLSVVVLSERHDYYGMVVDKFLGERELVVQVLPPALGKVQDISAAALMEDGSPLLIVDVDDLIRSIEKVLKVTRLGKVSAVAEASSGKAQRVLVVDDSITVREVERKLLESAGYEVETAVDGVDGLNMLRSHPFDLLVTDVDMPRMNGIELVKTLRQDSHLRAIPVLMVSYKDREEDRVRGLEAGADYYLTKGSFHDETLLQAAIDLIGEAGV